MITSKVSDSPDIEVVELEKAVKYGNKIIDNDFIYARTHIENNGNALAYQVFRGPLISNKLWESGDFATVVVRHLKEFWDRKTTTFEYNLEAIQPEADPAKVAEYPWTEGSFRVVIFNFDTGITPISEQKIKKPLMEASRELCKLV